MKKELSIYFKEINKNKTLTNNEIKNLFIKLEKEKNENKILNIKNKIIKSNLKLVVFFAKAYKSKRVDFFDLIQEGNLGLIHAVDKFDYRKNIKFSTYCFYWIRQKILRYIKKDLNVIKIPIWVIEKIDTIIKKEKEFFDIFGREPSINELSDFSNLDEGLIVKTKDTIKGKREISSLDYSEKDCGRAVIETIIDEKETVYDVLEKKELGDILKKSINELPKREKRIIQLRYNKLNEKINFGEIGEILGLSYERIRQIESKALNILKNKKRIKEFWS